ncbi:PadR family transcriptional regulator [Microlunatus flavus]|nr:helix-turn-helix transcriptional regulator [Microlunatus flavus]
MVLGMLSEEPLHPYAMRQRIRARAYDRMPGVRFTSLYDAVRRLDDAGLVVANEPARAGNRPERTPFTITARGRAELAVWLEDALAADADADGLPAALSFMYPLGRDRVLELLTLRSSRLAATIDADESALAAAEADVENPIFLSEHHFQLARRRAERDWLTSFTAALSSGDLQWPT